MSKINKKIGFGSLSLLLCIIGILFSFSFGNKGSLGDVIINFLGLRAWSHGNRGEHYTIYYTFIFFIPSIILGFKFKDDLGAKLGKMISFIMLAIIFLFITFSVITSNGSSQIHGTVLIGSTVLLGK